MEYAKLKKGNQQLKEIIGVLSLELEKVKKRPETQNLIVSRVKGVNKSLLASMLGLWRFAWHHQKGKLLLRDEAIKERILQIMEVNPSYGHRRIALGLGLGKRRIRRVMKKFGIKPYKRLARWRKRRDEGNPPAKFHQVYDSNRLEGVCTKPGT